MYPRPSAKAAGPLGLPPAPGPTATPPAAGSSRPSLLDVIGARMLGSLAPIVQQQLGPAAGRPDPGPRPAAGPDSPEWVPPPPHGVPILPAAIQVARQPAAGRAPRNSIPPVSSLANGGAWLGSDEDASGNDRGPLGQLLNLIPGWPSGTGTTDREDDDRVSRSAQTITDRLMKQRYGDPAARQFWMALRTPRDHIDRGYIYARENAANPGLQMTVPADPRGCDRTKRSDGRTWRRPWANECPRPASPGT